jgi:NAD(P)-dependent dehydrogenase (short-subunit alcohol dehydrogenase family)
VEFRDRVVVVTGASSGIGWDTALAFARRGAVVVGVARREAELARLAAACQETSPRSHWLAGDLGDQSFAESMIAATLARHGRLDVLVNNAAMPKHKHIYDVAPDEAERVLRVNFLACVWTSLAALPAMLRAGEGWIVNVSSVAGTVPPPRETLYAASKAALDAFTFGLAADLEGSGIHAALVVPGAIDTEIWQKLDTPPAYRGAKAPASVVTAAIFAAIEKRRYQIVAPRRPELWIARLLRFAFPALLRRGLRRMDPVPPAVVEAARRRAQAAQPSTLR